MRLIHAVTSLICLAATACMSDRYPYTSFATLGSGGWAYGDSVTFAVTLPNSTAAGDLLIDLTHDNSYQYSNLWLEITYPPTAGSPERDTVEITLCDPVGKWFGRGIEGLYQLETPLRAGISLTDSTSISIRHIMRVDTLRGLSRIGLTLKAP